MSARVARTRARDAFALAVAVTLACAAARCTRPAPAPLRDERFACSHVFLPMAAEVRRDYVVTVRDPGVAPYRYTQSYALDGDGFAETLAFSNGARRVQRLRCDPGGGWRALATSVEGAAEDAPGGAVEARGVTSLPAAGEWRVGTSWSDTGELASSALRGLPPALAGASGARLTGTVTVRSTIAASEPIEVPAGRFDTYRVDATSTQRVVVDTGVLGEIPVELVTTTRTWFASGVGMVRQQAEPYGLTTELTAARGVGDLSSRSSGR